MWAPASFTYLEPFRLPASVVNPLQSFPKDRQVTEEEFLSLLDERLPNLGPQQRSHVLDAAVVAAYHARGGEFPVIRLLICDDAPRFKIVSVSPISSPNEFKSSRWGPPGTHRDKIIPPIIAKAIL